MATNNVVICHYGQCFLPDQPAFAARQVWASRRVALSPTVVVETICRHTLSELQVITVIEDNSSLRSLDVVGLWRHMSIVMTLAITAPHSESEFTGRCSYTKRMVAGSD